MAAHYARLPTDDPEAGQVAFDFGSAFKTDVGYSADKYKSIFKYGSYARRMDPEVSVVKESLGGRLCGLLVTVICFLLCVLTFPISVWFSYKIVSEREKLVVFRLGRLDRVKGPGLALLIPCIDRYTVVDTRIKAFNVPPLQILTSDGGIIEMGADVYHLVTDVIKSVTSVQDVNSSLRTLVRTSLTNHMVKLSLSDIEFQKSNICSDIQALCNKTTLSWGVEITRVEFSPIKVLQNPQAGATLPPAILGGEALPQAVQQLAQAFLTQAAPHTSPATMQLVTESGDPGAGASSEDVKVVSMLDPRDLVKLVKGVLSESLVRSVKSTYQFIVSGSNGGVFYLDLKNGSGAVGEGPEPSGKPDTTLEVSSEDLHEMFTGTLKPLSAYMSGRLKVSGDLSAAMDLDDVIKKVKDSSSSVGPAGSVITV